MAANKIRPRPVPADEVLESVPVDGLAAQPVVIGDRPIWAGADGAWLHVPDGPAVELHRGDPAPSTIPAEQLRSALWRWPDPAPTPDPDPAPTEE